MKRYLTLFVRTGGFFGLFMSAFFSFPEGNLLRGMLAGATSGFLFGTLTTLFTFIVERPLRQRGIDTSTYDAKCNTTLSVDSSTTEAYTLALKAVQGLKKSKVVFDDPGHKALGARVGMSWKSLGEIINVDIGPTSDGKTTITISSKPWLPTTLVDYGKNYENVENILAGIEANAQSQMASRA